jgi:hypothetical protein
LRLLSCLCEQSRRKIESLDKIFGFLVNYVPNDGCNEVKARGAGRGSEYNRTNIRLLVYEKEMWYERFCLNDSNYYIIC